MMPNHKSGAVLVPLCLTMACTPPTADSPGAKERPSPARSASKQTEGAAPIVKKFFRCYKDLLPSYYPYRFITSRQSGEAQLDQKEVAAYLHAVAGCGRLSPHYKRTLAKRLADQLKAGPQDDGEPLGLRADPVALIGENDYFMSCVDTAQARLRENKPGYQVYSFPAGLPLLVRVINTSQGWQIDAVTRDPNH